MGLYQLDVVDFLQRKRLLALGAKQTLEEELAVGNNSLVQEDL